MGVEPTLDLRPNLISNQAPSTTRPPLRNGTGRIVYHPRARAVDSREGRKRPASKSSSARRDVPACSLLRSRDPSGVSFFGRRAKTHCAERTHLRARGPVIFSRAMRTGDSGAIAMGVRFLDDGWAFAQASSLSACSRTAAAGCTRHTRATARTLRLRLSGVCDLDKFTCVVVDAASSGGRRRTSATGGSGGAAGRGGGGAVAEPVAGG